MTHKSFDSLLMLSFNTALRNSAVIWSSKWGFQYMHLMIKQCQYSYMMTTNIIRLACAVFVFEHFHAPSILKDCWFSWGKKGHISLISVELFGMLIVMCWSKCCFINNSGVLRAVSCGLWPAAHFHPRFISPSWLHMHDEYYLNVCINPLEFLAPFWGDSCSHAVCSVLSHTPEGRTKNMQKRSFYENQQPLCQSEFPRSRIGVWKRTSQFGQAAL